MAVDCYNILGLDRSAPDELIDKAYRVLARRLHPDTGTSADPEQFNRVQQAYETLNDPAKRATYDASVLEAERSGHATARDVYQLLPLRFEQAVSGGRISVARITPDGPRSLDIDIPPAVENGERLRINGYGHGGAEGDSSGDLVLIVAVEPHRSFRREGLDLYVEVSVPVDIAMLGGKIKAPTLNGAVDVDVPAGTSGGANLRVRAKGLHNPNGQHGDLFVVPRIKIPRAVADEARSLAETSGAERQLDVRVILFDPLGNRREFALTGAATLVGRKSPSDLVIPDTSVSRRHCQFEIRDDELWIHDVGSRNGTFVNRERAEQTKLEAGDVVTIGHAHFVVQLDGEPGDVQPTPSSLKEGIEAIEYLPVGGHLPATGDPQQQADYAARLAELDEQERDLKSLREEVDRDRERLNADRRALDEERETAASAPPPSSGATEDDGSTAAELAEVKTELESVRGRLESERSKAAEATGQLEAMTQQLASKGADEAEAAAAAAKLAADVAAIASQRDSLATERSELEAAQRELEQARGSVESDRAALAADRESLSEARERFESQQSDATQRLDADRAELDKQREAFLTTRDKADAAVSDLDSQRQALEQTSQQLEADHNAVRQQREQLESDRQSIDARTAELDQRASELEAAEAKLASDRESLGNQREASEAATAALESQRRQLDEQAADLTQQSEAIAQTRRELDEQRQSLDSQAESQAADRESADEARTELDTARAALDKDRAAIEEAEAALETSAAELERRTAALGEREGAAADRDRQLDERSEAADQLDQQLAERESQLAAANQQLDHRAAELDARAEQVAAAEQRADELRRLETSLNERAAELDSRSSELSDRESALADQNRELEAARVKLEQTEREAEGRILELEQRAAQLVSHLHGLGRGAAPPPAVPVPTPAPPPEPTVVSEIPSDLDSDDIEIAATDADIDADVPAPLAQTHGGPAHFRFERVNRGTPVSVAPAHVRSAAGYRDRKGHWHLFVDYIEADRAATHTWNAEVRYYRSESGSNWQWAQTPMPRGQWTGDPATSAPDCYSTASPAVVVEGDQLLVFYAGRGGIDPDDKPKILAGPGEPGYLRSVIMLSTCRVDEDGSPAEPFVHHGPVVEPGDGWDSMRVDQPTAAVVDGVVHLFYTGYNDARDLSHRKLGYATASLDKLTEFTRHPEPVLEVPGGGETPRVFRYNDRFHLFYQHFDHMDAARWRHYTAESLPDFTLADAGLFPGPSGKPGEVMVWLDATGRLLSPHGALVTDTEAGVGVLVPYELQVVGEPAAAT